MQRCSFHCTQSVLLLIHIQKWPNAFSVFLLAEVVTYRNVEEEENLSIFLLFLVNDLLNINSFLILFLFSSNYLFQSSSYFSFSCTTLFTFFLPLSNDHHTIFFFFYNVFVQLYLFLIILVYLLFHSHCMIMFLSCFFLYFSIDLWLFIFCSFVFKLFMCQLSVCPFVFKFLYLLFHDLYSCFYLVSIYLSQMIFPCFHSLEQSIFNPVVCLSFCPHFRIYHRLLIRGSIEQLSNRPFQNPIINDIIGEGKKAYARPDWL